MKKNEYYLFHAFILSGYFGGFDNRIRQALRSGTEVLRAGDRRQNKILCSMILLLLLNLFSEGIKAEVRLPRLISSGMVLQRDVPLKIWGWAGPKEKVKVVFLGKAYETRADAQGNWNVELPACNPGGPFEMQVNEIRLEDLLVGDVWLCSGQSNMELPVRRVLDLYASEIKKVNNPDIRLFKVPMHYNFQGPQTRLEGGAWLPATSGNIMDFSAVAYFFANALYQKYGIPIGLINTAVGGSPVEAWLDEATVKNYPQYWDLIRAGLSKASTDSVLRTEWKERGDWVSALNRKDPGVSTWSKADADVSDWPKISLPGYWTEKRVAMQNGSIWFSRNFEIQDSLAGREAVLRLGRIIDSDSAFVNGTFVGTVSYQYPPRIYKIPAGVLKPGINQVMVRVISQEGKGGLVEEKPYEVRIGKQIIDLTGEWYYHTGAEMPPSPGQTFFQYKPVGLYNGMIAPILNYQLKGVIWYQGESNTDKRASDYRQLFQDLIHLWRTRFDKPGLPFLYVQLANLGVPDKQPVESNWAEVRDAQRRGLELPHTGMAVACDIGEWNDIHPLNKKEVGRRLSLEAMRVAYHDSTVVSSGPLYQSMEIDGNGIILTFSSVGSGLFANNLLEGFQIRGADGQFVWAHAVVLSKNKVRVWNDGISNPAGVRYAWDDNPAGANLKNKEGLPASPFTTEE